MTYIKNSKLSENSLIFEIDNKSNNFKISFLNALRRIILSEINTWSIDENKTEFIENNSILNNEFLKHRLSLIPIISNKDVKYENLVISCDVKNEEESIKSIYVSDFEINNEIMNEKYKIEDFIKYPKILFAKLQNNEYFSFNASLSNNSPKESGTQYCPVSTCVVTFKNNENDLKDDLKKIEKDLQESFIINNKEKIYEKNNKGDPLIYEMKIESIGFFDTKTIMEKGLTILEEKINLYEENIKDFELQNGFYILTIDNQNDTLGNLISSYINDDKDIEFSGYIIEHPLYEKICIKIKTNVSKDNLLKIISKRNEYLKELIQSLKKEIKSLK